MANNIDIKYNGYSAVPSDYECQDGDLAAALNLIPENGALHPISEPNKVKNLSSDSGNIRFIHKGASYTHYILQDGNIVKWMDANQSSGEIVMIINITSQYEIYEFNAIGNTLLVLTSGGIYYNLWKDGKYVVLGTHIPECPISFGLQGEMRGADEFWVSTGDEHIAWNENSDSIWLSDYEKNLFTNAVLGHVNKFVADNSVNDGRFIFPFFVRYAYRLYDGSLTMHSAPVLMVCTSDVAPLCVVTHRGIRGDDSHTESITMRMCALAHQLDYAVQMQGHITQLEKWSDIVKSIDIFISKPIYTYDQNGEIKRFINEDYHDIYSVCKHTNQAASLTTPIRYQKQSISYVYAKTFMPDNLNATPKWRAGLPAREGDDVKADIANVNIFYLLKSINIQDLKTERTIIPINKEYLQSLVTREVMTDDYNTHDNIIPRSSFVYNSRLNIVDIHRQLFQGYPAYSSFPYTDGNVTGSITSFDYKLTFQVYYYIKQDGRDIIVRGDSATFGESTPFLWFFYPDINAYKVLLSCNEIFYRTKNFEVPLEPHPFLNGAYYFGGWEGVSNNDDTTIINPPAISSIEDRTISIPNKIYTSEINNPYYFPLLGINTVGTGRISAVCSAAKALSEGQFGQFPLYAFTDEGVWALEVSSTGTYSARQPITRDVCINSDGITQLDSAVLFPTDRGIMLISGSQTTCISDAINSEFPFDALTLPGFSKLHDMLGHDLESDKCLPTLPFTEFLKQCKVIYDYVHQRAIVYAPGITYAYVFSLKSKGWGMIFSNIASHLNSYPEALAVDTDNNIVNFSDPIIEPVNCLYVSRPIKLDAPNVHKTIEIIIQRGNFRKGHVSTVLYGSRDLVNWHLVWSSKDHYLRGFRGTPYKYYRIAGVANLDPHENIVGASIQFTPKLTNQPR